MHTCLAIVGFQLRQFLKAQGHTDLIASSCSYQTVYLMEIQRRQLINDDADRYILALTCIDTGDKSIQYQSVQSTNDTFHLRVIGNQQITRMFGV